MTADELDTARIRNIWNRQPGAGYTIHELCDEVDRLRDAIEAFGDLAQAEIDRLRAALAFHVDNLATGGGASARAAGGVQPAPAATWTEAEIREAFRSALFYSAPDTEGRLVFGYADPHVYLDTDPYLAKAENALISALSAVRASAQGAAAPAGRPACWWCGMSASACTATPTRCCIDCGHDGKARNPWRPGGRGAQDSGHEYTSPAFGVDRCCVVVAMSGGERDVPISCGLPQSDPIHHQRVPGQPGEQDTAGELFAGVCQIPECYCDGRTHP